MSAGFVAALQAEIADLETELARDVRFTRLRELRRVATLYGLPEIYENGVTPGQPSQSLPKMAARAQRRAVSPDRARALEESRVFLSGRSEPTSTSDVLEHLNRVGVTISGKRPVNNLSAILSTSGFFAPNGRSGWTLKNDEPEQAPDDHNDDLIDQIAPSFEPAEL